MKISYKIDTSHYSVNKSGNLLGPVWIELKDFYFSGPHSPKLIIEDGLVYFPGRNWDDFVVTVLGWWLESYNRLLARIENIQDFDFMDGPYSYRIARMGENDWRLELIDRGADSVLVTVGHLDIKKSLNSLLSASSTTIKYILNNNLEVNGFSSLEKMHKVLSQQLKTI